MTIGRAVAAAVALAACTRCGGAPATERAELPETKPAEVTAVVTYDPTAKIETREEEVSFKLADHEVPGTLIQPLAPGKYPGIVMMAGSGPTDRNWESRLLPGTNGSGRLFAQLWASHGAVVLRFDKAAIGENKLPHDKVTFDTYVDELRGALNLLRTRDAVDVDHLFLVGNSEGGLHVIRAALGEGGRIAGVVLISSMGRTGRDISVSQNQALFDEAVRQGTITADAAKDKMDLIKQGLDTFIEGRPMPPELLAKEPALAQFATMPDAKLVRDMWSYDPAEGAKQIHVPVLIVQGLKDLQIDPQLDAARLESTIRGNGGTVQLFLAPDANHVMKHETRPLADLRKAPQDAIHGYNDASAKLDDTAVSAIDAWLMAHTGATAAGGAAK
nr:alpha/beta hydrolase [Kofleriaceae bacterium]